ncbi:MAG: indole-3-glycerol phosphate synthase TrpC [Candidatus Planktophila sp.]|uniref:indole-3-glycerol-phosphate synthase n=1 Tax=freshwater metagenome TaxID=449393 RepID=A0A6J6TQF3_9ZZZZ|nr:indole-3-glycerol phosphate synthase TrpC [Candidatus Planktophila sp.]MSY92972.1 indole-3-glycerol phosphate synthase TrpC [Actinomycetota bacterium]
MSVLDSIIEGVREDLAARRGSMGALHERIDAQAPALDAHSFLSRNEMNVIAEVKRSSPSKGNLAPITDPAALAEKYQEAGAAAVSVLTEQRRFGGSLADLDAVRSRIEIPVLRKDFMVDEYQFLEARAHGADIVLLIVAALSKSQLKDFYDLATELGMASLIEVHTQSELESAMDISPRIVGVNSRNLKTLEVSASVFEELIPAIPSTVIRVAESGISTRADVAQAQKAGATAILVGESLVKSGDPISAMRELLGHG